MHVNFVAVLISAVIMWILGALWYGVLFKKSWRKLVGYAEGEKPKNMIFGMVTSFIACLILSFVMAHIATWAGSRLFTAGSTLGVICWLGFMAPPLFAQHIYEGRRANLFAINAGYWLLAMAIAGGLLSVFH
jgi:hypothetical protein